MANLSSCQVLFSETQTLISNSSVLMETSHPSTSCQTILIMSAFVMNKFFCRASF